MLVCVSPALVVGPTWPRVSYQPVVCMRLVEARQPVCVPGATHSTAPPPTLVTTAVSPVLTTHRTPTEAGPAEDLTEDTRGETSWTERVASRGLACLTLVSVVTAVPTVRSCWKKHAEGKLSHLTLFQQVAPPKHGWVESPASPGRTVAKEQDGTLDRQGAVLVEQDWQKFQERPLYAACQGSDHAVIVEDQQEQEEWYQAKEADGGGAGRMKSMRNCFRKRMMGTALCLLLLSSKRSGLPSQFLQRSGPSEVPSGETLPASQPPCTILVRVAVICQVTAAHERHRSPFDRLLFWSGSYNQPQALQVSKRSRPKYRDRPVNVRPLCPPLPPKNTDPEPHKPDNTEPQHLSPVRSQQSSMPGTGSYMEMKTEHCSVAACRRKSWELGEEGEGLGYMMMSPQVSHSSPELPQDDYVTMASPHKHHWPPCASPSSSCQTSFNSSTSDSCSPVHPSLHQTNELLTSDQQSGTETSQSQTSIGCSARPQDDVRSAQHRPTPAQTRTTSSCGRAGWV
ncbi:insulin receptor substrate 2-B-like isoform X1 [Lates japonicus]|uniref:Insulin receptor substrate 2-B-like isoform X1 n=1 Tax=Lates japonicus TaxID=270547 RepID=A0AAD3RBW4_LATJO|nr:insulin receptor substrate 2-B-like isoform X1 [Lates japonicus]